jgi:hypothetical protein
MRREVSLTTAYKQSWKGINGKDIFENICHSGDHSKKVIGLLLVFRSFLPKKDILAQAVLA